MKFAEDQLSFWWTLTADCQNDDSGSRNTEENNLFKHFRILQYYNNDIIYFLENGERYSGYYQYCDVRRNRSGELVRVGLLSTRS